MTCSFVRTAFTATLAVAMMSSWSMQAFAQSVDSEATRAVQYTAQIERSLMAIEDGRRELPRDRWDPQYVVDTIGIDPSALFAYVRDEIAWVPYLGKLRGPTGVLLDRQANSLDSSLLLADMISRAGYQVRLARAKLPHETVDALWAYFAEIAAQHAKPPAETASGGSAADEKPVAAPVESTPPARQAAPVSTSPVPTTPAPSDPSGSPFGGLGGASGSLFEQAAGSSQAAATPDEAASLYELDKAAAIQKLSDASAARTSDAAELDRRTIAQSTRLLSMLSTSMDGAQQAYEQARAKDALGDHWWVQVQENGDWVDYDPLAPEGQPRTSWTMPDETYAPGNLPPELTHRVVLRVVAEQLLNGKLVENKVFEHEMAAADVVGKPISLRHLPMLWPADWAAVTPDDVQEKLFAALLTQSEWMPGLTVGGQAFQQASIRDTGAVNPNPQPRTNPFLQITFPAAGKVGRVADIFDQLLDETATPEDRAAEAEPGNKPRASGELTAEWLEYVILVPGEAPKVTRREVFDLIGPAMRLGGDLSGFRMDEDKRLARAGGQMTETELVILPAAPAEEYLADMTAQLALSNKPLLTEFTRDPFGKSPPNSIELFSKMSGMPGAAYLYSTLRSQVGATQGLVFVDRPQLVAQHGVLTRVGPGEMTAKTALDVIENGVGVDPFAADPFVIRVLQGVADTNAEAIALGDGGANVGEAFEKAAAEPEWTVFFPEDGDLLATLGLPLDILARLQEDLNNGQVIISPGGGAKPFELAGWWRVDPQTGTTLGMGNNGWGAVLVEYAFYLTIQVMLAQISCMAFNAAAEEKISSLTAEQGRERVKTWARSCVSQALLETVAGLSTSWITSRFLEGAKVPTWNDRARGNHASPHGPAPHSGTPHNAPDTPRDSHNRPPREANNSNSGGKGRGDPFQDDAKPPRPEDRRKQGSCRVDAGLVRFAALETSPSVRRDFADPIEMLLAAGAGCGPPGGHVNPQPSQFPEAVKAARQHTDDYVKARQAEVEAAKRYHDDRTYENRQAYKEAAEAAQAAHWKEMNAYHAAGGAGLTPGARQAPKIPPPPPGWEPLPPLPGESGYHPSGGQSPGHDSGGLPSPGARAEPGQAGPQLGKTQPMDGAPPLPGEPQHRSSGGQSPGLGGDAQPSSEAQAGSGETGSQLGKTQSMDGAPPRPPQNDAERVEAIRKQIDDRIAAQQRESEAERRFSLEGDNPSTRRELEQAYDAANKAHMAELEAWARAGGSGFPPTKDEVLSPSYQPRTTAEMPASGVPSPVPGASPRNTLPMQSSPDQATPAISDGSPGGTSSLQPGQPAPQSGARPSDTRLAEAISHYSAEHANAHREYIDAVSRANADPSLANRQALDRANLTLENAKRAEAAAWFRVGGSGFPPMSRPGALPDAPAVNIPPLAEAPATPNNTLAMGLGALAGAVQKGP